MMERKVDRSQRRIKDLIFYLNLLTFDVKFNHESTDLIKEDIKYAKTYTDLWIRDLKNLKREL